MDKLFRLVLDGLETRGGSGGGGTFGSKLGKYGEWVLAGGWRPVGMAVVVGVGDMDWEGRGILGMDVRRRGLEVEGEAMHEGRDE